MNLAPKISTGKVCMNALLIYGSALEFRNPVFGHGNRAQFVSLNVLDLYLGLDAFSGLRPPLTSTNSAVAWLLCRLNEKRHDQPLWTARKNAHPGTVGLEVHVLDAQRPQLHA